MAVRRTLLVTDGKLGQKLEEALLEAGCDVIAKVEPDHDFHSLVVASQPAMLVISIAEPDNTVFEQLGKINVDASCAVVMFVQNSKEKSTQEAVKLGVGAYIVDGFVKQRIKPILDIAETRFSSLRQLQTELQEARSALTERKLIDRAKGMLMEQNGLSESQAYKVLRSMAMKQNAKISDVARSIVVMQSALAEI